METLLFDKNHVKRFDFASERAHYYFKKLKNTEKGGGNISNSLWATKFAQAVRIENHYKKQFTKSINTPAGGGNE